MRILETVIVAFSMFSAVPMPQINWNEKNLRDALCAFPLVGLLVGGLLWGWLRLADWLVLPDLLRGAAACVIPVLVTGGIHLDGFADTLDAVHSRQSLERKQEILKDPHIGTFAVIRLSVYFLLSLGLWSAWEAPLGPLLLLFPLSRSLSGLAVASFPMAKNTGLAHTFASAADRKTVRAVLAAVSAMLAVALAFQGPGGIAASVAAILTFAYYRWMSEKQFGGISGDLAGWFLQTAELWMLAALCAGQYWEAIL